MTTKYYNTDKGNGFEGVLVNETLNSEIEKRTAELDKMHEVGNWTKEMEEREVILDKEINDLLKARTAFENYN